MTILLTLHIIVTLAMIGVILLQKSDGGSSLMGAGSSASMFSARGVANLLTHATSILAALFLVLCIAMTWLANHNAKKQASLLDAPVAAQTSESKDTNQTPKA
jgi:preprotein translocase subunit SecG